MTGGIDEIVWQLVFSDSYEFAVLLNPGFAKKMITAPISRESQDRMNQLANEELKRLQINWSNPYEFRNNSCFVSQVYLGQNGLWLSTDLQTIEALLKDKYLSVVKYYSHNSDTSHQAFSLMTIFGLWMNYSDLLLQK